VRCRRAEITHGQPARAVLTERYHSLSRCMDDDDKIIRLRSRVGDWEESDSLRRTMDVDSESEETDGEDHLRRAARARS